VECEAARAGGIHSSRGRLSIDGTNSNTYTMTNTPQTNQYPNIAALLDQAGGHISIGRMPPIEGAAVAVNDQGLIASLVRREGESFPDLLQRLDTAIGKALQEGVVTNEINGGRFRVAPSGIRKKR
jgi:hypothetical protein